MTRSIFDPDGGETERSGSTFTGPDADQISQMPPDVTDGEVTDDELADHNEENPLDAAGESDIVPGMEDIVAEQDQNLGAAPDKDAQQKRTSQE